MKAKLVLDSLNEHDESIKSRGATQKVLDFIEEAGPGGRRYTDIIKFVYELKYGPGTYTRENRGYWSGGFKTPSRDDRGFGHLMKYITKNENGRWILRDKKMTNAEAAEASQSFMWPEKTKYKEQAYPSNPRWREEYDEKGNFRPFVSRKYYDAKKARGEDVSGVTPWDDDEE